MTTPTQTHVTNHAACKESKAAHSVTRDVMPEVGRTPGAAEPLQECGTGPDNSLDLKSRFTSAVS